MNKLVAITSILLGVLLILKFFGVYDLSEIIGFDLGYLGAIYLVVVQLFHLVMMHGAGSGSAKGTVITIVLTVPALLYIALKLLSIDLGFDVSIATGFVLLIEGVYGLH